MRSCQQYYRNIILVPAWITQPQCLSLSPPVLATISSRYQCCPHTPHYHFNIETNRPITDERATATENFSKLKILEYFVKYIIFAPNKMIQAITKSFHYKHIGLSHMLTHTACAVRSRMECTKYRKHNKFYVKEFWAYACFSTTPYQVRTVNKTPIYKKNWSWFD